MTEQVKSPAGEWIEVMSDDDFVALTGNSPKVLAFWGSKGPILEALWVHGPFVDLGGRATANLYDAAVPRGYTRGRRSLIQLLNSPAMAPAIARDVYAKTTRRIALTTVPRRWADKLQAAHPSTNGPEPEPVEAAPIVPEPDADDYTGEAIHDDDALRLEIAQSVATALLGQVVDIISTGKPDTTRVVTLERDLAEASTRLANAVEESERQRRKVREVGDELAAVKHERDGLRQRVKAAEANLDRAINADRSNVVRDAVNDELARVMRATPVHRSPDDG